MADQLEQHFSKVLGLTGEARRSYLQTQVEPGLRDELDALLQADADESDPLRILVSSAVDSLETSENTQGLPTEYRIQRRLGQGGSGVVYLAERIKDGVTQQVAIKMLTKSASGTEFERRFLSERRILASMSHPNIAHVIDAGRTGQGNPFLVLEFVDGQPIDAWATSNNLDYRTKIRLFLQVCEAVEYAHQRLIIHRDLKPANILVANDGTPKLLDFGLARDLDVNGELTATHNSALTPRYASPEQMQGKAFSVATDVYSLAVVLFELLSGQIPYQSDSFGDLLEGILHLPPAPISDYGAHWKGDLENILNKALRKEPERRYQTVGALADDLRRYLAGFPVQATPTSRVYELRLFLRRKWPVVLAATAAGLAVVIGTGFSWWQAQVAAQRFEQTRGLATSLLFNVQKEIERVPGATKANEVLLDTAVKYLEGLAAEAGNDRRLWRDLAEGYQKVGTMETATITQSTGRAEQGERHLRAALDFRRRLGDLETTDPEMMQTLSALLCRMHLAMLNPDFTEAEKAAPLQELEQLAKRWQAQLPQDPIGWIAEYDAVIRQGQSLIRNDELDKAHVLVKGRSERLIEGAEKRGAGPAWVAESRAMLYTQYASYFGRSGDPVKSLDYHYQSVRLTGEAYRLDKSWARRGRYVERLDWLAETILTDQRNANRADFVLAAEKAEAVLKASRNLIDESLRLDPGDVGMWRMKMINQINGAVAMRFRGDRMMWDFMMREADETWATIKKLSPQLSTGDRVNKARLELERKEPWVLK